MKERKIKVSYIKYHKGLTNLRDYDLEKTECVYEYLSSDLSNRSL